MCLSEPFHLEVVFPSTPQYCRQYALLFRGFWCRSFSFFLCSLRIQHMSLDEIGFMFEASQLDSFVFPVLCNQWVLYWFCFPHSGLTFGEEARFFPPSWCSKLTNTSQKNGWRCRGGTHFSFCFFHLGSLAALIIKLTQDKQEKNNFDFWCMGTHRNIRLKEVTRTGSFYTF